MVARSKENTWNAGGLQSVQKRLVVRHDDRPSFCSEIEKRVVRRAVTFDGPVVLRELGGGPRIAVVLGQQVQLRQHGGRNRHPDLTDHASELRLEMDLERERPEQGVGLKQDETQHRCRASKRQYSA